ncbi:hypothetical protein J7K70_01695 [bacterium]|nr:hypothetical protein [bacterium]
MLVDMIPTLVTAIPVVLFSGGLFFLLARDVSFSTRILAVVVVLSLISLIMLSSRSKLYQKILIWFGFKPEEKRALEETVVFIFIIYLIFLVITLVVPVSYSRFAYEFTVCAGLMVFIIYNLLTPI